MTHYGYNEFTSGWKEEKRGELANRLRDLLLTLGYRNKTVQGEMIREREDYRQPYIENYHGVKIRKITYLSDNDQDALIEKADTIYKEIMK